MNYLDLIKLRSLMDLTSGNPEIRIGLIDGPVALDHPDLAGQSIREISGPMNKRCSQANSLACRHGTFVAGILSAKRSSVAPAICPDCTLLVRSIFVEPPSASDQIPSATPEELSTAIIDSIKANAQVLNLSVVLTQAFTKGQYKLEQALDYAAKCGVIVVAAAGNQGTIGSTVITRHPWVIPVVACDHRGRPMSYSNLGNSIGRRGLGAPGENVTSLGVDGKLQTFGGTSAAAPFVTGAIALLYSVFPTALASEVKFVITQAYAAQRTTVVPPLLDAWVAYQLIANIHERRRT